MPRTASSIPIATASTTATVDPGAHVVGDHAEQELPDSGAAVQEEDEGEQHQQGLGEDLPDGRRGGERTSGDGRLVGAECVEHLGLYTGEQRRAHPEHPWYGGADVLGARDRNRSISFAGGGHHCRLRVGAGWARHHGMGRCTSEIQRIWTFDGSRDLRFCLTGI
jgi:hypothetical protein